MNPVTPAARWHPTMYSRRPYMGQGGTPSPASTDVLTVTVRKDGSPLAGVPVEVMLASGDTKNGVTDPLGKFLVPYTGAQKGQTIVRITTPENVEDLGEGTAQGVDLKGGPAAVAFELVGIAPSPYLGLGVAGALYGLVLVAF